MRSGTGRHRRPKQVPAVVLAAGVTGASIAMPLLAATGAQAADTETWDRVAQCESGGMWSAHAGNGFSGGLQMTQEMWEANGGTDYAPRPDLASRSQQIAVAERVLKANGPTAWPSCGLSSGLSRQEPAAEVDPGRPEPQAPRTTPEPSHGTGDSTGRTTPAPSGTPSAPAAGSTTPAPDASQGTATPTPAPSTSSTTGSTPDTPSGKHRKDPSGDPSTTPSPGSTSPSGTPAPSTGPDRPGPSPSGTPADGASTPSPAAGDTAAGGATGDDAGRHQAEPQRSGTDERTSRGGATRTDKAGEQDYTVRPGDNLSVIAEQHSVSGGWQTLYQKNQKVVGSDPDLIHPGQHLEVRQ
ncbi:peptidoglycan-binding protein LysM [Streptomyces mashuensis]|uniref:Peptidoglycan-binding protein LysM n=1 Tax=Streptomyces mashuensis TaxID=33904 RepID=A0A919B8T3_9ACTN|nr:transglycosylase family protein [Streptomyces mashuensis]GHF64094.1 peptidoglycan-binding protein LysM [Streptomyces mashuensis]